MLAGGAWGLSRPRWVNNTMHLVAMFLRTRETVCLIYARMPTRGLVLALDRGVGGARGGQRPARSHDTTRGVVRRDRVPGRRSSRTRAVLSYLRPTPPPPESPACGFEASRDVLSTAAHQATAKTKMKKVYRYRGEHLVGPQTSARPYRVARPPAGASFPTAAQTSRCVLFNRLLSLFVQF